MDFTSLGAARGAKRLGGLGQARLVDVPERDPGAGGPQALGGGLADALGAAGHDRVAAGEIQLVPAALSLVVARQPDPKGGRAKLDIKGP